MSQNFRVPWKTAHLYQDLPTTGAGSVAGDPVVVNGGLAGINIWGTGKGEGIPAGSDYGMVALDGTPVITIATVGTAITEGTPIYLTSAHAPTLTASTNVLLGYADEPKGTGSNVKIGVRLSAKIGV